MISEILAFKNLSPIEKYLAMATLVLELPKSAKIELT